MAVIPLLLTLASLLPLSPRIQREPIRPISMPHLSDEDMDFLLGLKEFRERQIREGHLHLLDPFHLLDPKKKP